MHALYLQKDDKAHPPCAHFWTAHVIWCFVLLSEDLIQPWFSRLSCQVAEHVRAQAARAFARFVREDAIIDIKVALAPCVPYKDQHQDNTQGLLSWQHCLNTLMQRGAF